MVYTLTLNPALDHVVKLNSLKLGETNRSYSDSFFPGGKGINVSRILNELGVENKAMGFLAGFSGREIERLLEEDGVNTEFIKLEKGNNRINVKIKADQETEINGAGPEISRAERARLLEKLFDLEEGDYLVLAGSIPNSLDSDFYKDIMEMLKDRKVKIIVDATGDSLMSTLRFKPLLIKPNKSELEEITGKTFSSVDEIIKEAASIRSLGAENVIVSLGSDGAVLIDRDEKVIYKKAPKGEVKNTVGSGDSMVAGFIAGLIRDYSSEDAFTLAVASGSATAFTEDLAKKEMINKIFNEITGDEKV